MLYKIEYNIYFMRKNVKATNAVSNIIDVTHNES